MPDFLYERRCGASPVCGVDEAGRGPLAGPVVAAAVIFPDRRRRPYFLDDSKQLTPEKRAALYDRIMATAIVGIGMCDHEEIDIYNIFHANLRAMARAVAALGVAPVVALIDGNAAPALNCRSETIVGGDGKSASIAAASIIAKVTRDRMMVALDATYPGYGFAAHKGYACPQHKAAIRELGPCPVHRRSFRFVAEHMHLARKDWPAATGAVAA
jgi:ribonuclease HII